MCYHDLTQIIKIMIKFILKKSWVLGFGIFAFSFCGVSYPKKSVAQDNVLLVNPVERPVVQRCFIEYNGKKLTECATVGDVTGINYAIDLSNGSIINTWRGAFIDATTMWTGRGQEQLAKPLGKVNIHSDKPAFAVLENESMKWPGSIQDGYVFKGYSLNESGRPIFSYILKGIGIEDQILPAEGNRGLTRTLTFTDSKGSENIEFLLAESKKIEKVSKSLYAVDESKYHIQIDEKKFRVLIKQEDDGFKLIAQPKKTKQINYSIIW